MRKVLVTGGGGYLGSVLVPMLLQQGMQVTVIDNFAHGIDSLAGCFHDRNLKVVRHDIRRIGMFATEFVEADVIIPLAAIVGTNACNRWPVLATEINTSQIEQIVRHIAPGQGLIYPCTNSGYGVGGVVHCDESSPLRPLTHYGRTKVAGESIAMLHSNAIGLRFATLFGISPRMRLDLMVNDFVFRAVRHGRIELFEAEFRRNFLHVRDAAKLLTWLADTMDSAMIGNTYNCGDTSANMTKRDLCREIQNIVPMEIVETAGRDPDQRDYIISNAKLEATGWRPTWSLQLGIAELAAAYRAMPYTSAGYSN